MKFSLLDKMRPEIFFLYVSLCFGLIILIITPPFQIPDETNHFYKAYQISEGKFVSIKKDNRLGGNVPVSLVKVTEPFLRLRWNENNKIDKNAILKQLQMPLVAEEKVFVDFPNTGLYSFVTYAPQALSIFISRCFSLPSLWIFYLSRLFALVFWVFCVFYAIKIIPVYKWFFCLLALLPMSLFINMSLSGDVVTNALAFMLIAYILRLAFCEKNVTSINFLCVMVLSILLALSKIVYTPLIFIFLIIPKDKFVSTKAFYFLSSVLFCIAFLTVLFWSNIISGLYIPYSAYDPAFRDNASLVKDADIHDQLHYILTHGFYFFDVMYNSMTKSFDMYFEGYIGTFGWLDTNLPKWLVIFSYLIILIVAFIGDGNSFQFTFKNKFILFFSFIAALSLLLLSQHLTWDIVGGDRIVTIQGRYLIPILPLLFMICKSSKFNYIRSVPFIVIIFSGLSLVITVYTLFNRYYS
jgi:uncharacterized membrane protein